MIIRNAVINDAEHLVTLNQTLGYSTSVEQIRVWLADLLSAPAYSVLVAEQVQLLGWIVVEKRLTLEAGYKAEITGLVVDSSARRRGLAKQLVMAAEEWAREQQLSRLVVRSNIARKESHLFYQSQGYGLIKTVHNYEKFL